MIRSRSLFRHFHLLAGLALAFGPGHRLPAALEAGQPTAEAAVAANPAHASVEAPVSASPAHAPAEALAPKSGPQAGKTSIGESQGLLNLGARLTDRGDYEAAEIAYRQLLKAPDAALTDTKSALLGLARMHRKQGAFTKAAAIYEKYLKEYPGDDRTPDALLDLGRTLRAMGVYKNAIARFYSVINSTLKVPADGFEHYQVLAKTAQFEIAETHFQSGDFVEASKFFSRLRLLDLAPADRARAQFKAGYALHLAGDFEGAVAMLQSYIEQCPEDENLPEGRYLLAIDLRALNRPQEALATTLDLLRTEKSRLGADPKRWAYWQRRTGNQLANDFFEHGRTHDARLIYDCLLALAPDPAWRLPLTYQIALCEERLGATDLARKSYQGIIDGTAIAPTPELAELGHMAAWRLEHLDWHDGLQHQISTIFETSTGRTPAPDSVPPPAPALP